ncbi:MAG: AAA family ATPase [Candidatus Diapherotrites archaeon]|nr:AAA family ATPase [Candidatus Diapherotrites archaeon]
MDYYTDLRVFANNIGIVLPEEINLNGEIHRFCGDPTRTKKDKDEWYVGNQIDAHITAYIGTWKGAGEHHVYRSWNDTQLSPEEIKALHERQQEFAETVRIEKEEMQVAAASRAKGFWDNAPDCKEHPYLTRKQVQPGATRQWKEFLLLPLLSAETGEIISAQFIAPSGEKRFLKGGRTEGGYFLMGSLGGEAFIAEGFATGATVHEITGKPVVIAFSAANCAKVAAHLVKQELFTKLNLLQDLGTAGEKVAIQWKTYSLGDVYTPKFKAGATGKDWNDLAVEEGGEVTKRQLAPKRYPSYSLKDFMALDTPPSEWAIDNIFAKGSVNVMHAKPGHGKSMIALYLATGCIAGAEPIQGHLCKKQNVLLVDAELTSSDLKDRVQSTLETCQKAGFAFEETKGLTIIPWMQIEEEVGHRINLYDPISQSYLNPHIEEHDFIILDNLDKLTQKTEGDSYRADEVLWQGLWNWLKTWKIKGKTILIIHHETKSGQMRGTGKIADDVDVEISIQRLETKNIPKLTGRLSCQMIFAKARQLDDSGSRRFIISLRNIEDIHEKCSPWEKILLTPEEVKMALDAGKEEIAMEKLFW